jgi:hypothetical protein
VQRRLVSGSARDRQAPLAQQPGRRLVEMVGVQMGDEDRVHAVDDLRGPGRQLGQRVRPRVRGCWRRGRARRPDRASVDEEAAAGDVDEQRGGPDEGQFHAR